MATSDADYCAEFATTCAKLRELHTARKRIAELEAYKSDVEARCGDKCQVVVEARRERDELSAKLDEAEKEVRKWQDAYSEQAEKWRLGWIVGRRV